ncbi:hypothetical protein E4T56_gene11838 [Termitomyces sp. T112]|nr:hypothetical protein E4T56_gene11838 [Termitomyces sp. T112]
MTIPMLSLSRNSFVELTAAGRNKAQSDLGNMEHLEELLVCVWKITEVRQNNVVIIPTAIDFETDASLVVQPQHIAYSNYGQNSPY